MKLAPANTVPTFELDIPAFPQKLGNWERDMLAEMHVNLYPEARLIDSSLLYDKTRHDVFKMVNKLGNDMRSRMMPWYTPNPELCKYFEAWKRGQKSRDRYYEPGTAWWDFYRKFYDHRLEEVAFPTRFAHQLRMRTTLRQ